jgi:hypothetical protein
MKRLTIAILAFALLLLAGCNGGKNTDSGNEKTDGEVSIVEWEPSSLYTDDDINDAIDAVISYFETEFKGCTLKELSYPGDTSSDLFNEYAEEYKADEAIILNSSFDTDASGGDGTLNPNSTYNGWQWILVRDNGGIWEVKTYGYG